MSRGSITIVSTAAFLVALSACSRGPKPAPAIGEAFVGPAELKIRSDIPLQSAAVATVKHGERLVILGRRRRYFRVRTPNGAEGWTDERQLLAAEEMSSLRDLAARAAKMPVQGQATSYGDLNVHTQPSRQSPSFLQIKENEKMDVLAHMRLPRADPPRKPLIPPVQKKAKAPPRKSNRREPKIPPPPMPKAPPPPANWLELSKTDLGEDAAPPEEEPAEKPMPTDSWSLVRVAGGQSGWVLTRRLTMAISDEVAQYAEGRRIFSYFALGAVDDGGEKKNTWLWTTVGGIQDYDFDSFRVFTWGLRRHRYETAYIERNVKGYAPVLLREVEYAKSKYPGFSVCVEKKDGTRARREYALLGNTVRYAGEQPCEPPAPLLAVAPGESKGIQTAPEPVPEPTGSFTERVKRRVKSWFGK